MQRALLRLPITSECSLNGLHIVHVYTHVRSIANSTRKCMQMQINARKCIAAIDAWVISACKRDYVLRIRSKTFRMYYMWRCDGSLEKCSAMKTALHETAGSVLGSGGRWQPDWFRESEYALRPLFEERKRLHTMWLSTGQQRVRKNWLGARRVARKAMRRAKNAWFERKAAAAQKGRNKGKVVWRYI